MKYNLAMFTPSTAVFRFFPPVQCLDPVPPHKLAAVEMARSKRVALQPCIAPPLECLIT